MPISNLFSYKNKKIIKNKNNDIFSFILISSFNQIETYYHQFITWYLNRKSLTVNCFNKVNSVFDLQKKC